MWESSGTIAPSNHFSTSNPLHDPDSLHTLVMVRSSPLNVASNQDLAQLFANQPVPPAQEDC